MFPIRKATANILEKVSPKEPVIAKYNNKSFFQQEEHKPNPAFGTATCEINPNFNHKSIQRRNAIKRQAELARSNMKKAGIIKSIGDVVMQEKKQKKQEERTEKLKEYLQMNHSYW